MAPAFFLASAFLTMVIFMGISREIRTLGERKNDGPANLLAQVFDGDVHEPRAERRLLGDGRFGLVHVVSSWPLSSPAPCGRPRRGPWIRRRLRNFSCGSWGRSCRRAPSVRRRYSRRRRQG